MLQILGGYHLCEARVLCELKSLTKKTSFTVSFVGIVVVVDFGLVVEKSIVIVAVNVVTIDMLCRAFAKLCLIQPGTGFKNDFKYVHHQWKCRRISLSH